MSRGKRKMPIGEALKKIFEMGIAGPYVPSEGSLAAILMNPSKYSQEEIKDAIEREYGEPSVDRQRQ